MTKYVVTTTAAQYGPDLNTVERKKEFDDAAEAGLDFVDQIKNAVDARVYLRSYEGRWSLTIASAKVGAGGLFPEPAEVLA